MLKQLDVQLTNLGAVGIFLIFLGTAGVILASIAIGFYFGRRNLRQGEGSAKFSLGSINSAMLALLGFILAFSFSLTSTRHNVRRQLVLQEANAIGTAFLRTEVLPEPYRTDSRRLFREYVDARVGVIKGDLIKNPEILVAALGKSEEIHRELWSLATREANQVSDSEWIRRLFYLESLNDVIDLHSERVTAGLYSRIPRSVWLILYFIMIQTMLAVGYEFGLAGKISVIGSILLALMFSAILLIIVDLDRTTGKVLVKVNQQPLLELQKQLNSSPDN